MLTGILESSQIERLRTQNQQLTQLLQTEKVHSAHLKDDLVKQISALLLNFTLAQSQSLATAIDPVLQHNVSGMKNLDAFKQEYETQAEATREKLVRYGEHVNGIQEGYQALRQEGHKVSLDEGTSLLFSAEHFHHRLWLTSRRLWIVIWMLIKAGSKAHWTLGRPCFPLRVRVCYMPTKPVSLVLLFVQEST